MRGGCAALPGGREHSGPLAGEGKNRLFGAGAQHAPAERSQPADGDRVIVTQNNAYYNICNGDVGVLHIRGEKPHRVAALAVRGTLKTWQIDRGQGEYGIGHDDAPPPQLALAYALTVHKSQGSQYDTVLMPVSMATARMLYRNLLYTAISQAGKEVILVGSREALNTAMQCIPYPRKSKLVARTNLLRLGRSA